MKPARYGLDALWRHSETTAHTTRRHLQKNAQGVTLSLRQAFDLLSRHFDSTQSEPKSHSRNVRLALTARFINHLHSFVMLAERGLLPDAVDCSRSATETMAFHWRVCRDPEAAGLYDAAISPRPGEVRRRLEELGIDVSELKSQYGRESSISHVGNPYDDLQIAWAAPDTGTILVGGGGDLDTRQAMVGAVIFDAARFLAHDARYVVSIGPEAVSINNIAGSASADGAEGAARS